MTQVPSPSPSPSPSPQAGSNDRKRDLVVDLIDKCGPSLVTGRMADIYALGQVVVERGESPLTPSHPHTLPPQL